MTATMQNKLMARRVFEEYWNKHESNFTPDLYTKNFTLSDPFVATPGRGLEAAKKYFETYTRVFPDLTFTIEEQVAEGDTVVTRLLATGTHEGELFGVPATHVKATVSCVVFHRFEDGRIASAFSFWDAFSFLRATGAFPPSGMAQKPAYAKL
jgi:steroid delta-isomerase-like uncharacterized protein